MQAHHVADAGPAAVSPDVPAGCAVTVVGIGADGWDGLPPTARAEIDAAEVLIGGARQLALVPPGVRAERLAWPSPMLPAVRELLSRHAGRRICVLASGDPMFHGVGTTLVRLLGIGRVRILPHPSSVSLACARLGWPVEDTPVASLVGRPLESLNRLLRPGGRVLVLSAGAATPRLVAGLLCARGYGATAMTVLEQLGGPAERVLAGAADRVDEWAESVDSLNIIALELRPTPGSVSSVASGSTSGVVPCSASGRTCGVVPGSASGVVSGSVCGGESGVVPGGACVPVPSSFVAGLPDEVYEHDGQLTKREVRAVALASLAPLPGRLLWDVGAGAGSIGIEWMRGAPGSRAIAVEARADRAERITRNAASLGVPGLRVVTGTAPAALAGLKAPDAVFVGGGATVPGLVETCWDALRPGGRLVVAAVTVESEAVVASWHARAGGDLTRVSIQRAGRIGGFTAWRPAMPVTLWTAVRP
ncbi:hypothetical protein Sme01_20110 [Sphaerisporangium melleum]|uniref:Tetrapyrrole methylase domain-containing protein n=1 Tax=Sphaerisporangium melleum TaxID=321316 RepID=A0A917RLD4_9ACTN|nr:precorrin-6y C5,15-methyltransferase (decarboxylating) subunit CbiE [Sphaerisporangium melleum]GGL13144.1 hypothetical protein GCM10007964_64060 [Sphaerisporangium melleum]GII69535.1 hypothetical protein Sme01_20110 [Sphaerisporangium melleum]